MPVKKVRLRYAVDDLNRLLVKKGGRQYAIEGEFRVEKNNLIFEANRKSPLIEELNLPRITKFYGNWHLTENRDLRLVLKESNYQNKADELEIKGRIISCQANEVVFAVKSKKTLREDKISLLHLGGRWQANESNELNFLVTKHQEDDILKFKGSWRVNKKQEIVYAYEKEDLIKKTKAEELITLRGFWQINSKDKINYILDLKNKSFFEFKVKMLRPNLKGDQRSIKYSIGIGVKSLKQEMVFSLYGRWQIMPRKNILFEIDYGERGMRLVTFGADVFLRKNNQFVFELKNSQGENLGIRVTFKRNFFKKRMSLFARIAKWENTGRLEAGAKIIW